MSYEDRLKKIRKKWQKEKPASTGGASGDNVPEGRYQCKIKSASLKPDRRDDLRGRFEMTIVTGEHAGKRLIRSTNLEWPANDNKPSGIALYKADLESLGAPESLIKDLDPKELAKFLKGLAGTLCEVAVAHKGSYQNVYINGLIEPLEEDEEEKEEGPEDESEGESEEVAGASSDGSDDDDLDDLLEGGDESSESSGSGDDDDDEWE